MVAREAFRDCKLILEHVCHSQFLASWVADLLWPVLDSILGDSGKDLGAC